MAVSYKAAKNNKTLGSFTKTEESSEVEKEKSL